MVKLSTLVWSLARYTSAAHTTELQSHLKPAAPLPLVTMFLTAVSTPRVVPTGGPVAEIRSTSVRSTSVKLITPLSLRLPAGLTCFFFNDTATTEIYTLSLHDALPISSICLVIRPPF